MKKIIFFILLLPLYVLSHPVIYKGGWVYWGEFGQSSNSQVISYTFHPNFSIGVKSDYYSNLNEYRDYKLGMSSLIKRWYLKDSQANIYTSFYAGDFGQNVGQRNINGGVLQAQLDIDWESRSLYTAFATSLLKLDGQSLSKYSYRIGFAPYIAGMNVLQTWLILQFRYFEELENKINITPMMRFFYKNVLWEIGSNLKGSSFLTLMVHY